MDTATVVGFLSPQQAQDFAPGDGVKVVIGDTSFDATVTTRADRRSSAEAMSEVLGSPVLALAAFQDAGNSPIAVTVEIPNLDGAITDGAIATLRRVVSDPTIWALVMGGGR
jgi:hypothetical protein